MPNVLDLSIYEPESVRLVKSCSVGDDISTDHLPVITTLEIPTRSPSNKKPCTKKILRHDLFIDRIKSGFVTFDSKCNSIQDVDAKLKQISEIFMHAVEQSTKKIRINGRRQNLPEETLSWIRLRKSLLKERKKAQTR
jgi:hypothetical protein